MSSEHGIARFARSIKDSQECDRFPSIARENQDKLIKARKAARRIEY